MKAVHIYLTKKNYKVVTTYRLESGSYIDSNPIFILPENVDKEELSLKISLALEASRQLSEKEEDKYWLGNKLLKELKESSFNKLYENSKSCKIYIKNNRKVIQPYKCLGKNQGLTVDESRVLELDINTSPLALTEAIINLLKDKVEELS